MLVFQEGCLIEACTSSLYTNTCKKCSSSSPDVYACIALKGYQIHCIKFIYKAWWIFVFVVYVICAQ